MPERLGQHDAEKGLRGRETQRQARLGLPVRDGIQGRAVDVAGPGGEEQRERDDRDDVRRNPGFGEDHIEEDEQQHQFRDAGDEAVVHARDGADPAPAAAGHPIQPGAQHRPQKNGQEADFQRFPEAAGDVFPAVFHDEVFPYAVFQARGQAPAPGSGFAVQHEIGGVVTVVRLREQEFFLSFGGDEDTAAEDIGKAGLDGKDAGTRIEKIDLQGAVQFLSQFPQQVDLQAVPLPVHQESDGRGHRTDGDMQGLASLFFRDMRKGINLGVTVREPEILQLLHRTVFLHPPLDVRHRPGQLGFVLSEHKAGRKGLPSPACDLDAVLFPDNRIVNDFIVHHDVGLVIQECLQGVTVQVVPLQGDIFALRQLHIVAAAGNHGHPQPGEVVRRPDFHAVPPVWRARKQGQGGQKDYA